jgi:uncharacterized membrane protein YcgQ (UPF0703/DUF1980 family)
MLLYYHFEGLTLVYDTARLSIMADRPDAQLEGGNLSQAPIKDSEQVWSAGFKELTDAAQDPAGREKWSGRMAELKGLYNPVSDRQFSLFRLKMTCCASDAVPVKVRIFAPDNLEQYGLQSGKGVVVTGQIQFRKVKGSQDYFPVMKAISVKQDDIGGDVYDTGQ